MTLHKKEDSEPMAQSPLFMSYFWLGIFQPS